MAVLFFAAFPVWSAGPNPLDSLCRNTGNNLVAAVCDLRDRVITLEKKKSVSGPAGPQGERGPKGDPGPKGERGPVFKVKQADGEVIGTILGMSEDPNGPYRVWRPHLGKILSIDPFDGSLLFPETRSVFFYESEDCSGTPLKDVPMLPYYIYRLEGDNPYGWTHVTVDDFDKIRRDVLIRSQWEGNPEICIIRNDVVGVMSELMSITPPVFRGPLTIVEE